MPDTSRLKDLLRRIDGRPYPAWRDLRGSWQLGEVTLLVDHVQGDPFAAPSRVRVRVPVALDPAWHAAPDRRLAVEDWLLRRFAAGLRGTRRGSGRSGALSVLQPGPEIVERSAVRWHADGTVEARFTVGLPARGRRVLGQEGEALLLGDVVAATAALGPGPGLEAHVDAVVRQRALRRALAPAGLVAFIADGAVLPRASGVDAAPLDGAVPFVSPDAFRVTLDTQLGPVVGMGIGRGVTVITGGGFHGKSTVLQALEHGHLDHIPGDGRDAVVARSDTVRVRAEDGRAVTGVDISAFLGELPGGRDTTCFTTADASGSTSQAAAIVEAVESGAGVLLIDEDTSATNLLVRDARMQALVPEHLEPIRPLVAQVQAMHATWGVSCVLVVGGVGDYLAVADRVVAMAHYVPSDVTARARALAGPAPEEAGPMAPVTPRVPLPRGLSIGRVRARDGRAVELDKQELDLTGVAGVLGAAEARSLGETLAWLGHSGLVDGRRHLGQVLDALDTLLDKEGVEVVGPFDAPSGDLVRPRRHEVAAALSRWRGLEVR